MGVIIAIISIFLGLWIARYYRRKYEVKKFADYFLTPPRHWFFGYTISSEDHDPVGKRLVRSSNGMKQVSSIVQQHKLEINTTI